LVAGTITWFYAGSIGEGGLSFATNTGVVGFVTTVAHFALAHAVFGALVGVVVAALSAVIRRAPPRCLTPSLTLAASIAVFMFMRALVESNLSLPAYVPLDHPMRSELLRPCALAGLRWGALGLAVGIPVFMGLRSRLFRRALTVVLALAVVVTAVGTIGLNLPRARQEELVSESTLPETPGKVIIIGLDGATWQLLDVFSSEGLLPNIDRLRASGTSTNLVTHGRRISPAVWTGIATGWSHKKHGVTGFTVLEPSTGKTRIVRSSDRRKPALWQIVSELGGTSVVINWWASYPAEKTNGVIVARIVDMDAPSVYPRELLPAMKAIVDSSCASTEGRSKAITEIETVFNLAENFTGDAQPDLLMMYVRRTDTAQHVYWASHEPEQFGETWAITPERVTKGRRVLREIWSEVDRRIGQLVALASDDTTVLIVSDHGFKPRAVPLVMPELNVLLNAMGYVVWADAGAREADLTSSRAFVAVSGASESFLGIFVNAVGRQAHGIVPPDSVSVIANRLTKELSELRVEETGEPLFRSVGLVSVDGSKKLRHVGADVYVEKGNALRVAGKGRTVEVGGVRRELDEFLAIHATNTGNHDPRGVFLGLGPALRDGVFLPLVAESPYARALTYVTGYEKRLEGAYRILRRLGALDQYTSIDIAPTVLYLLGLPSSAQMEGRLMARVLAPELLRQRPLVLVESFEHLRTTGDDEQQGTLSEQTLEQLRALGYLQ
jgi:predicted AlkP superfamily phosphohydrolase/phosphomutase